MCPNIARPRALIELAERYVSNAFDPALFAGTRVDLYRLAKTRAIHTVEFRPLLADGCLLVDNKGFAVQINDQQPSMAAVTSDQGQRLSVKQRFTFAHEIAHTLPYDITRQPPRPKEQAVQLISAVGGRQGTQSLEGFCQIAAGLMLVPTAGLKRKEALGRFGRVDSLGSVLRLAQLFDVSPEVVIHRVADSGESEAIKAADFALIMVRDVRGEGQIRASICSPTLKSFAGPPKLYSRMRTWVKRTSALRNLDVLTSGAFEWEKNASDGVVRVVKKPYGRQPGSYFLELKYNPR